MVNARIQPLIVRAAALGYELSPHPHRLGLVF
jgi:hypothetical protein